MGNRTCRFFSQRAWDYLVFVDFRRIIYRCKSDATATRVLSVRKRSDSNMVFLCAKAQRQQHGFSLCESAATATWFYLCESAATATINVFCTKTVT